MLHHFHDDRWKSPERPVGGLLYLRISKWANACDRLSSSRHSPALGCLQSQRPSGGRCQCGLQRWGLPLSRQTEMKRKEGRRGRTLKTHSGRPEATVSMGATLKIRLFMAPHRNRGPVIHALHLSHASIRQLCSSEKQLKWVAIAGVKESGNLTSGLTSPTVGDLGSPVHWWSLLHRFCAGEQD